MKARPIILRTDEVRGIHDGRKTQIRRPVNMHNIGFLGGVGCEDDLDSWGWSFDGPDQHGYMVLGRGHDSRHDHGSISIPSPFGEATDRLWVKETWGLHAPFDFTDWHRGRATADLLDRLKIDYKADWSNEYAEAFWRAPLSMPRWASRTSLAVLEVRVQRVQDISEEDAKAEGVPSFFERFECMGQDQRIIGNARAQDAPFRASFACTWDEAYAGRRIRVPKGWPDLGHARSVVDTSSSWHHNPFVWALTVKKVS